MKKYKTQHWQINLPDDWQVEEDEGVVAIFHLDGIGELQLSTLKYDEPVTGDTLLDFAEEHVEAGAEPEEITLGEFDGIVLDYEIDDEYGCEWYLASGSLFLFATYICDAGDEEQEHDVVELILESLAVSN